MNFCTGVDDNMMISIADEITDERILKVFEILNYRLNNYESEHKILNQKNVNVEPTKNMVKITKKIKNLKDCIKNNAFKIEKYKEKKPIFNQKTMKNNQSHIYENVPKPKEIIQKKNIERKDMIKDDKFIFPRIVCICPKNIDIKDMKKNMQKDYPNIDCYIKIIKKLKNRIMYTIFFGNEYENNLDIKNFIKNVYNSKESYVISNDSVNMYFEINRNDKQKAKSIIDKI